jgi:hypothetical protein
MHTISTTRQILKVLPSDHHGFDHEGDGIGCET